MPILEIKKYGNPILRIKSKNVIEINNDVVKLSRDMIETMRLFDGVGLAAPQVGISINICVISMNLNKSLSIVMINPIIISWTEDKIFEKEGCLSLPGFYEDVKRNYGIVVQYMNLNGKEKKTEAYGLLSRIIQHEVDHLNAKLFIDYLPEQKKMFIKKKMKNSD
ncbi:MAG: peptide deformylase [Endomicrobium sp.]|jgi:peptide deformylase|nr:peptide deformylase [Endomicrobium sp.]